MRPPSTLALLLTVSLCAVAAGCAGTSPPAVPTPAPAAAAESPRALPAWDALATDLAERIVNRLSQMAAPPADGDASQPVRAPASTLASLSFRLQTTGASTFDQAFHTLLGQRLLALGLALDDQEQIGQIDLSIQLIERGQRPPLVLVSTQVRALGRLQAGTADVYLLDAADLPLFTAPAAPAVVKTWRMAPP